MRWVAVDYGRRRLGLAVSDASATLARPLRTVAGTGDPGASVEAVAAALLAWSADPLDGEPIDGLVVGWPRRLSGEESTLASEVRAFAEALSMRLGLPVHFQDERLSSHEADARLRERDRDWRSRKAKLDAAAAAVILQDFLDERARRQDASTVHDSASES